MKENLKPLDMLACSQDAVVHSIEGGRGVVSRLSSMGLHPGVRIRVVCTQPARGPVVVEVGRATRLALGRGIARKVIVNVKDKGK